MLRETLADFSLDQIRRVISVFTSPGATALIRIPREAYDAAADCMSPITPAFAAAMSAPRTLCVHLCILSAVQSYVA